MKKIAIDSIANDMILAKEVRGKAGNVLLNKGAVLNPVLGRRLKNWDITYVYVEGEAETLSPSQSSEVPSEEIRAKLEKKFSAVIHNPIMKEILAAVYQFRVGRGR